jgi:hypothetical protein
MSIPMFVGLSSQEYKENNRIRRDAVKKMAEL